LHAVAVLVPVLRKFRRQTAKIGAQIPGAQPLLPAALRGVGMLRRLNLSMARP
jgi:hypothetical protein